MTDIGSGSRGGLVGGGLGSGLSLEGRLGGVRGVDIWPRCVRW